MLLNNFNLNLSIASWFSPYFYKISANKIYLNGKGFIDIACF